MSKTETEYPEIPIEEIRVTVEGDVPTLELPTGQKIRLRVSIREWTHERPMSGEYLQLEAETDYMDNSAWWELYPERSDLTAGDTSDNFPSLSIEPEVIPTEEGESDA